MTFTIHLAPWLWPFLAGIVVGLCGGAVVMVAALASAFPASGSHF